MVVNPTEPLAKEALYLLERSAMSSVFEEATRAAYTSDRVAELERLPAHPIEGAGHYLAGVQISFRYVAGYGGGDHASTVSVSLVDALDGTLVGGVLGCSRTCSRCHAHVLTGCCSSGGESAA